MKVIFSKLYFKLNLLNCLWDFGATPDGAQGVVLLVLLARIFSDGAQGATWDSGRPKQDWLHAREVLYKLYYLSIHI